MRLSSLLLTAHTVALASAVALPRNPSDQGTQLNTVDKSATSPPTNAAGLAKVLAFLFANNNMPVTPIAAGTPPQKANSGTIQPTATTSANLAPQPGAVPQSSAVNGMPVTVPGQTKPGSQSVPTPPVNSTTGTTPVAPVAPPAPPANAPPTAPVTPGSPAPPVPAAPVTPKAPTTANPTSATGGNTTSPTTGTPPAINKTRDANDAAVPDGNVVALKKRAGPFIINAQAPQPRPPQGPSPQKISGPKMIPNGMIGMVMPPTVSHLRRRAVPGLSGDDAKEFGMESFETADAIPSQDLLPVLTSPAIESENETIRQVYGEEALPSTSSAAASPIMGNLTVPAYDASASTSPTSITGMSTNTPLASNGTLSASSLAQQDEEALAFVTGGDYGIISADVRAKTNSTANGLPGSSSPISTTGPGQAAPPNLTTANMPMGAGMSGYMPSNSSAVARSDAPSLMSTGTGTTALLVLAMMAVF